VEKKVQDKIIKTAKEAGFYVLKTRPGPGVPKGMLDILLLKGNFWGVIECKAYPDSKWQTLQKHTFDKFSAWSWARVAHCENVDDVCEEIKALA
jgi:Holliday junction resolvase